ncbi:MAG: patatin-like phospholipase family protein [Phaeodactylibacter sp.]|nr:patatin-like phospholipase family protein [Phaeodactylibacter sp.]
MKISQFTENPQVKKLLRDLWASRERNPERFVFSDVIDAEGHQYVDFVQEGGGMLGIALVGYTYILEQMGLRFVSLAGTSAGAINTILLASLARPDEMKSLKVIELLVKKNFFDFVDGSRNVKKLVQSINKGPRAIPLALRGFIALNGLRKKLGLNPGKDFYQWLEDVLDENRVSTTAALKERMNQFPESIRFRNPAEHQGRKIEATLGIVAADLTTETKVVFPKMSELYFEDPEKVHPAKYVRASMSIPLFFQPFLINNVPLDRASQWYELASYTGDIPDQIKMADGGFLSNFPIDLFHVTDKMPSRPTLGVKLGLDRTQPRKINTYLQLMYGCFNTASKIRDFEFIHRHPDYRLLFTNIDVGNHEWLNFALSDEDKIDLFVRGADAAAHFLSSFNWEYYKGERRRLLSSKVQQVVEEVH